ncbi:radical SAM protein [Acidobacteriota bacterium]
MNTPKYWIRLARLFYHYKRRSVRLPYMPVRMWVELTSDCNYSCVMCPNKDLPSGDRGMMDFGLFQKIIDEAAGSVFEINLAHRGESLLHPQIIEAIDYSTQKGLFTRLHTNGSLLTEDLSKKILASSLDRLSFSFDGYDRETYEKIRRGGDFEKTTQNIVRFLEMKKTEGASKPHTAIEVINFKKDGSLEDKEAREAFENRFKDLPLDNFVIKDLHNWGGEMRSSEKGKNYSLCTFPWNAMIICWDGAVSPCTQDFFNINVIGNIRDSSIRAMWNSDRIQDLRKRLATRDVGGLKPCVNCDRIWRETFFGIPKEYLWKFITKRMP